MGSELLSSGNATVQAEVVMTESLIGLQVRLSWGEMSTHVGQKPRVVKGAQVQLPVGQLNCGWVRTSSVGRNREVMALALKTRLGVHAVGN